MMALELLQVSKEVMALQSEDLFLEQYYEDDPEAQKMLETAPSGRFTGKRTSAVMAQYFKGLDLRTVLENVKTTALYRKINAGQELTVTIEEVMEMLAMFDHDEDCTVTTLHLQAVLEEAFIDTWIPTIFPFFEDKVSNRHHKKDRVSPDDFLHLLKLGSPETVRSMSLKMHGMRGKCFVQRHVLVDFLLKKKVQHENFKAMPITIAVFCIVFYMVTSHLSISATLELNMAVSNGLKSSSIVEEFPDAFWSHLENHVDGPYIAHHNKILGGVRVSRIAQAGEPNGPLCDYSPWNYLWDEIRTAGKVSDDPHPLQVCHKVTTPSSWLHWQLKPNDAVLRFNKGETPESLCERLQAKSRVNLKSSKGNSEERLQTNKTNSSKDLELDESIPSMNCSMASAPKSTGATLRPTWYLSGGRTGTLQLELLTHNDFLGFYSFYRIQVTVLKSGDVRVTDLVESFHVHPVLMNREYDTSHGKLAVVVVDYVFFFLYLLELLLLLYHVVHTVRYGHFEMLLADAWLKVEILNVILISMIILGYFHCIHLVRGLNHLKDNLPVPVKNWYRYSTLQWEDFTGAPLHVYEGQVHGLIDQASRAAQSYKDLRWYIALFCFCSCLRFFKVFRANERLNIVFKTFVNAGGDLLHFLVIFMSLCMAFVLVAHVLFGSQNAAFATPGESTNSVLLFLLGYLFDDVYPGMIESGGLLGIIWSVLFMIMMVLISMNMVLAIIFDVYADVKAAAINDPWLWEQVANFWKAGKKESNAAQSADVKGTVGKSPSSGGGDFSDIGTDIARAGSDISTSPGSRQSLTARLSLQIAHGAHIAYQGVENAAHEIAEAFLEDHVLDALNVRNLHPEDVVTTDSLMDALGYHQKSYSNIEEIILAASEGCEFKKTAQEFSYISTLRLLMRIDENVRDWLPPLQCRAQLKAQERHNAIPEVVLPDGSFVSQAHQLNKRFQALENECSLLVNAQDKLDNEKKRQAAEEASLRSEMAKAEADLARAQARVDRTKAVLDAHASPQERAAAQGALIPPLSPTFQPTARAHPAELEKNTQPEPRTNCGVVGGVVGGVAGVVGVVGGVAGVAGLQYGALEAVATPKVNSEAAHPATTEEEIAAQTEAAEIPSEALQAQAEGVTTPKVETEVAHPATTEQPSASQTTAAEVPAEALQAPAEVETTPEVETEAADPATREQEIAAQTTAKEIALEAMQAQAEAAEIPSEELLAQEEAEEKEEEEQEEQQEEEEGAQEEEQEEEKQEEEEKEAEEEKEEEQEIFAVADKIQSIRDLF